MNSKLSFSCFSVLDFTFFAFLYNPGLTSDGNGSEKPEGLSQGCCTTKAPQGRRPLPKSLRFKSTTPAAHPISAALRGLGTCYNCAPMQSENKKQGNYYG